MGHGDKQLQDRVQSLLDNNQELKVYGIKARVNNGHVDLSGVVDTLSEKQRLRELVKGVSGVKEVDVGVAISTDGAIDDEDVSFEVAEEFNADPRINLRHVGARSVDGVVILRGTVEDPAEDEAAIRAAARARGVKDVVSRIQVKRKDLADAGLDTIFHSQVRNDGEADY